MEDYSSVEVFAHDKKCHPKKAGASEGVKVQSKSSYTIDPGKVAAIDLGFTVKHREYIYLIVELDVEGLKPRKYILDNGGVAVLNVINAGKEAIKIQAYDTVGIMFIVEPAQVLDILV